MGTLRAGQDHVHGDCRRSGRRRQADFKALVSHELYTGSPVCSAVPIPPEQRDGTRTKRMEQDADLARLRGRAAIPLTLLTQRTRAAVANASRIHHAQAAVGFSTPLLGMKRLSCGTTERSVGLERKVLTRKAPRFPGGGRGRRAIPRCGSGGGGSLLARLRDGGSKLSRAHRSRLYLMPQLQAQVPHPLAHDTPGLLTVSGVTTPPIGVDLLIFVRKLRFKGAAMQIQFDNVGSGEGLLGQIGEEQLVDHPCPCDAHRTLLGACWMGRHHHSAQHTLGSHRHRLAVIETADHLAFRALLDLIGRKMQTRPDERVIKDAVVFATGHKREARHIGEDRPGAILTIEPQHGAFWRKLRGSQVSTNSCKTFA